MNDFNNNPLIKQRTGLSRKQDLSEDEKGERLIAFAVCFQVSVVGIKNALVQSVPSIYRMNDRLNAILLVIIGLLYLWAAISNMNKLLQINRSVLIFAIFILVSYVITRVLFPRNLSYVHGLLPRMIPYYFVTAYMITKLSSTKWIAYYMTRFSYVIIVSCVISSGYIFYNGHVTTSTWLTYSMPLSYVTMLAVMWLLYDYYRQHRFYQLILAMIGTLLIVFYGSRNPLIAIISYVAVESTRSVFGKDSGNLRKGLYLLSILALIVVFIFYRDILLFVDSLLKSMNISSRTLRLLLNTELDLTGRTEIHTQIHRLLAEHPFLGLGVGGDVRSIGYASHGLYLSILSAYGYLIGSVLIMMLLFSCLKAYMHSNQQDREVLLIYLCLTLPRGFFGGDFSTSDVLWWMLGIIVVISKQYASHVSVRDGSAR